MIGHLGAKVTALLDGQLPAAEEERAWAHVHSCHPCRDAVEHEGWVKTRLAMLGSVGGNTPAGLRENLLGASFAALTAGAPEPTTVPSGGSASVRPRHLVALGGGALSVAVMGVIAFSGPANAPQVDRRGPITSITPAVPSGDNRPLLQTPSRPTMTATVRREAVREKMAP